MVGLRQDLYEVGHDVGVFLVDETGGKSSVTRSSGTADSVHVVVDVLGEIVVDNVGDVRDIQATSCHVGSDQDVGSVVAEAAKRLLSLCLASVSVDRGGFESVRAQVVLKTVRGAFRLDEDEGQTF